MTPDLQAKAEQIEGKLWHQCCPHTITPREKHHCRLCIKLALITTLVEQREVVDFSMREVGVQVFFVRESFEICMCMGCWQMNGELCYCHDL